jgi:hypothetical protein
MLQMGAAELRPLVEHVGDIFIQKQIVHGSRRIG